MSILAHCTASHPGPTSPVGGLEFAFQSHQAHERRARWPPLAAPALLAQRVKSVSQVVSPASSSEDPNSVTSTVSRVGAAAGLARNPGPVKYLRMYYLCMSLNAQSIVIYVGGGAEPGGVACMQQPHIQPVSSTVGT